MGFLVYPESYIPPVPDPPHTLTEVERASIKSMMQAYITNQGRPIWSGDLIRLAQVYINNQYGIFIDDEQLEDIAAEILSEWGTPGS